MVKKAFLSSVSIELTDYRTAVYNAIQRLKEWKCVRMEDSGAQYTTPEDFSRRCARECDLFILIVGHRYGSIPPKSDESYTEMEYNAARDKGIPRLVFAVPEDFTPCADTTESAENKEKQRKFRQRLETELVVDMSWRTPEELAGRVTSAIANIVPDLLKLARRKIYLRTVTKAAVSVCLFLIAVWAVHNLMTPAETHNEDNPYLTEFRIVHSKSKKAYDLRDWNQLCSLSRPLDHAEDQLPRDQLGQLYFWWGYAEYEIQRFDSAKVYFTKAVEADSKEPKYYSKLAWTHYALQEFDQAEKTCQAGLEIDPNNQELIDLASILSEPK